jgi:hypothetical protein
MNTNAAGIILGILICHFTKKSVTKPEYHKPRLNKIGDIW